MKVSKIYSAQVMGLSGVPISIETDVTTGVYSFVIVGLPDQNVSESKERVHAALKNSGYDSPKSRNHKLTVSLAPADIRKEGPMFDLAIAISYLVSVGDIKCAFLDECIFVGELSLVGELQKLKGALAIARTANKNGYKKLFIPKQNAGEAALIKGLEVYGVSTIKEVVDFLKGEIKLEPEPHQKLKSTANKYPDMSEVKGQQLAKRALLIAAAGGHNICLYGPPGTGKTMMAKAFAGILPELTFEESLEVTGIHSIAGASNSIITSPPLRSPHHTSSYVSIIGGGSVPKPGEITLAHRGVLFLDEFPQYASEALEAMREPLEDGIVRISRARGSEVFPAEFILLAAMNPCPCGYLGSKVKECICRGGDIERYQKKISGPIMDRIDLWVFVQNISYEELSRKSEKIKKEISVNDKENKDGSKSEDIKEDSLSKEMREKIINARSLAETRNENYKKINKTYKNKLNKTLSGKELEIMSPLGETETNILNKLATQLSISPRAYHRMIRVARTIADLDNSQHIKDAHIIEAFQYRPKLN